MLALLALGCGEVEPDFSLVHAKSLKELNSVLFTLNEMAVDYSVDNDENGNLVLVHNYDANRAGYVLNRLESTRERLLYKKPSKELAGNISLMEGVLNHWYEELDGVINISLVVENNTNKTLLERNIKRMMHSDGSNKVNVSFVEFDIVSEIKKYNYEYLSFNGMQNG